MALVWQITDESPNSPNVLQHGSSQHAYLNFRKGDSEVCNIEASASRAPQ